MAEKIDGRQFEVGDKVKKDGEDLEVTQVSYKLRPNGRRFDFRYKLEKQIDVKAKADELKKPPKALG